jgi:hypothetical protein
MKRPLNPIQLEELRFKYESCKTLQEYYNTLENDCFDIGFLSYLGFWFKGCGLEVKDGMGVDIYEWLTLIGDVKDAYFILGLKQR